jgi:hypothetical protein
LSSVLFEVDPSITELSIYQNYSICNKICSWYESKIGRNSRLVFRECHSEERRTEKENTTEK